MKLILLLLLLHLGVAQDCDVTQLNVCYSDYLLNFGYSEFPNYGTFLNKTVDFLHLNGWRGQDDICRWQNKLIGCLQKNSNCINTDNFMKYLNLTEYNARGYQTDYYVKEYECNTGYYVLHNTFYCFLKVWTQERSLINDCQNIMDPNSTYINCADASLSVDCTTDLFSTICGTYIRHFICTIEEIEIRANTHACDLLLPHC